MREEEEEEEEEVSVFLQLIQRQSVEQWTPDCVEESDKGQRAYFACYPQMMEWTLVLPAGFFDHTHMSPHNAASNYALLTTQILLRFSL